MSSNVGTLVRMSRFRTSARMVDLLGRQQIAGIPTAISELFKNAHDAYAQIARVDFLRTENLFVLRDDGVGMTRNDFERRWLTVGTDSKVRAAGGLPPPPIDPRLPRRPVLGEKGIGRLAVAAIGPQVMVLTRARHRGNGESSPDGLVVAFVHWGLFSCPGIDLEDIEIPVLTMPGGALPGLNIVEELTGSVAANLNRLRGRVRAEQLEEFRMQLHSFNLDPDQLDRRLGEPSLRDDGCGTHFLVKPVEDSLTAAVEGGKDKASPLLKLLIGFTNTMTNTDQTVQMRADFVDHTAPDLAQDLISASEFWAPEDFEKADHYITGGFDQYGQFRGTVSVYGAEPVHHIVPWTGARGNATQCGPFRITVGYVQGAIRQSRLTPEDFAALNRKVDMIGGLYVYRDGVRVLPYGTNEFDFLDIEERRTRSAGYYFFSYRRLFGAIEITSEQNGALQEKAGREGFRENTAYRQFRDVLMNFFIQIAADFFREGGTHAESFETRRAELERAELARRKRERQVAARREDFSRNLERALHGINSGAPEREVAVIRERYLKRLEDAEGMSDPNDAAEALLDAETTARHGLAQVRAKFDVSRPRDVGLSRRLRRDWEAYQQEYSALDRRVFVPAMEEIEELIVRSASMAGMALDRRRRLDRAVNEQSRIARSAAQRLAKTTHEAVEDLRERLLQAVREGVADIDDSIKQALAELASTDVTALDEEGTIEFRNRLEDHIEEATEQQLNRFQRLQERLESILAWVRGPIGEIDDVDITAALEEEVLALREQAELDLELTQLGLAIGVINHEFEASIRGVRMNLRRLRAWADANESLRQLYADLAASFEHLDSYLGLFTPLQRRLYRRKVVIRGSDVERFLRDLFQERLRRHDVLLEATPGFKGYELTGYPSSFYPVFVNLIDNALFWLRDSPEPRVIRLEADSDGITVSDSGPGIPARDREAIFELGFTRKPGGRGMGLHISRQVLAREGWSIEAVGSPEGMGAMFRLEPRRESRR
jgi:signal transduction histidine kinase